MNVADRNQKTTELMGELFARGQQGEFEHPNGDISARLDKVFSTTVWGYREILLVIVLARLLDPSYKAYSAFYSCNPRALYEGPIRTTLLKLGIPHRKSGPLNVAKATSGINEQWAAQRRPLDVAKDVVELVKAIEQWDEQTLMGFATDIHARFIGEAKRVADLSITTPPTADPSNLFKLIAALITDVPDAGNTPQMISGLLLEAYHEDVQTGIKVVGHEDRASVTSTTSKKPGDITEEQQDGTIIVVYEVTVKSFSASRIDESYQTLKAYEEITGIPINEVLVTCRQSDVPDHAQATSVAAPYLGKVEHHDVTYHFIDIFEWSMAQLLRMTVDARLAFYEKLAKYINDPNTAEKVKVYYREWHENEG